MVRRSASVHRLTGAEVQARQTERQRRREERERAAQAEVDQFNSLLPADWREQMLTEFGHPATSSAYEYTSDSAPMLKMTEVTFLLKAARRATLAEVVETCQEISDVEYMLEQV